jgi:hypothetical protein
MKVTIASAAKTRAGATERPPADAAIALVLVGLPAPGSGDRRAGC